MNRTLDPRPNAWGIQVRGVTRRIGIQGYATAAMAVSDRDAVKRPTAAYSPPGCSNKGRTMFIKL